MAQTNRSFVVGMLSARVVGMLHPTIGSNRFCGPAVLASVFGVDTGTAAAWIRDVTGKTKVFGVYADDLAATLRQHGRVEEVYRQLFRRHPLTLERLAATYPSGTYVVNLTGHYVALALPEADVCDNLTVYPLALTRYRQRRKHVKRAWIIHNLHAGINLNP